MCGGDGVDGARKCRDIRDADDGHVFAEPVDGFGELCVGNVLRQRLGNGRAQRGDDLVGVDRIAGFLGERGQGSVDPGPGVDQRHVEVERHGSLLHVGIVDCSAISS
jgi:hypothetical protein